MLIYENVYYQYNKLTERFITNFGSHQYDDSIHDLYSLLFPFKILLPRPNLSRSQVGYLVFESYVLKTYWMFMKMIFLISDHILN